MNEKSLERMRLQLDQLRTPAMAERQREEIDEFFDNLSVEEFEKGIIEAGGADE